MLGLLGPSPVSIWVWATIYDPTNVYNSTRLVTKVSLFHMTIVKGSADLLNEFDTKIAKNYKLSTIKLHWTWRVFAYLQ